jgi:hypothetical protein
MSEREKASAVVLSLKIGRRDLQARRTTRLHVASEEKGEKERAVTDIGDSANEKPAGGERRHIYIASSRRKLRSPVRNLVR